MATTGAELAIDGPPRTPPPSGLLRSATVIESTDNLRWINGEKWQGETCADAVVLDPCSAASKIQNVYADAATTNGSATLTSATAAFRASDVGKGISGAGIPVSTTVLSVQSATSITLSANATATATGVTITIAGRTAASNRPNTRTAYAFIVDAYDTCSAYGSPAADYEGRARRALVASESKAVERELATAEKMTLNRRFQDTGAVVATTQLNSGTEVNARLGLALLVQAAADFNLGLGMIHARPSLVTHWSSLDLLRWQNGLLYTYNGNLVVPGSGYTGAAPDGSAVTAPNEWAYVTDPIQVKRGPIEVFASEADRAATFDRTNNTVTVRAERAYILEFNACTIAGVNVDVGL